MIPAKMLPILQTDKRFIVLYGGRGSAKSWSVADLLLMRGFEAPRRILCTREIQNSIKDSVHKLLSDKIKNSDYSSFYTITDKSIIGANGTEFIFKGLYRNADEVKSTEGIDLAWVEESQNVSRKSLEVLTPTIRKPGSQIIFTYNPTNDNDPVHEDYTLAERDDVLKIEMNFIDNPWFPDELRAEMDYDKRVDYDKFLHKWMGQTVKHSDAQVFKGKWRVDRFDAPEGAFFYFGADWGFSQDPTALVRAFIVDKTLYIDYEAGGVGIDIAKTPALFDAVPEARRYQIIADSARPETISAMRQAGFNIVSAAKGKGSVIDGVEKIRSFEEIVIHERCRNLIYEMRSYCYKVDERTGVVSSVLVDKDNHYIDALRYALERVGKATGKLTKVRGW